MGLLTDTIFIRALKADDGLMAMLPAGDIYDNVADPDIDMANVPVPYIIVNNDGGGNQQDTKDSEYESYEDRVSISIRIVGRSRKELAQMSVRARRAVRDYMIAASRRIEAGEPQEGDELRPYDYTVSFGDVSYETDKPSCQQMLYFECITQNEIFLT